MKKALLITLILAAVIAMPEKADAQIKRLLKEKALEAAKGLKVDEKKTEETQQQKEEEPTPQQSKPRQTGPNFMERKMMQAMGLNNVKYDQNYNFTSSMVMDIETVDSLKNSDKIQYTTLFNPNDKSFALVFDGENRENGQKQKSTMIFDMKNFAMLILTEENGERNGVALSVPPDSASTQTQNDVQEQAVLPDEDFIHPLYKPTGRTKSIAGLSCKEYAYEVPEGKVSLWATRESKFDLSKAYGQMNGFQAIASAGLGYAMGLVMEMESHDKLSGAMTKMLVKEIKDNSPRNLSVAGYNIVGMGGQK